MIWPAGFRNQLYKLQIFEAVGNVCAKNQTFAAKGIQEER